MTFTGFPTEALDFYDDLEDDNARAFRTARKKHVDGLRGEKAPMIKITSALEE